MSDHSTSFVPLHSCRTSTPARELCTDPHVPVLSLLFSQGKRYDEHGHIALISSPATHAAFPSPLLSESHHIHQHWKFFEPYLVALWWYTSQGALQRPGERIDPQCHVLTLHSATQQCGYIQDPIWKKDMQRHQVRLGAWRPGRLRWKGQTTQNVQAISLLSHFLLLDAGETQKKEKGSGARESE